MKKKVLKHLKKDIKEQKHGVKEDKELMKSIKEAHEVKHGKAKKSKKHHSKGKVGKVMHEFKEGKLHSGSKKGPKVKNKRQALAIAMSEERKASEHIPKKEVKNTSY